MLQRAMGPGAKSVYVKKEDTGAVAIVNYPEGRRGIVELNPVGVYGGHLMTKDKASSFVNTSTRLYAILLKNIVDFFQTGVSPVPLGHTLEIMQMLSAADRSFESGKEEILA
jgi:hypothetical protein